VHEIHFENGAIHDHIYINLIFYQAMEIFGRYFLIFILNEEIRVRSPFNLNF